MVILIVCRYSLRQGVLTLVMSLVLMPLFNVLALFEILLNGYLSDYAGKLLDVNCVCPTAQVMVGLAKQ